jgi:threonine dehydrogenase-like Zn-dependent dehydrogenase
MTGGSMRAVAVRPGVADSLHVRSVPRPSLDEIPGGRGVLVRVLRVGLCGTDREINDAEFGEAPAAEDALILGHESLGRVEAVGAAVPESFAPGTLVVATLRRPGSSPYDAIGLQDFSTSDDFPERGIRRAHGFLAEFYADDAGYLVPLPASLVEVGVLLEPLSIVEKGIRQAFEIQRRLRIWEPRRAAVLGAGPVGLLTALALRLRGVEVTVYSRRPAPYPNSELVEAIGGRYVSSASTSLQELAASAGPLDLILEATGFSPLAFEAADVLAPNGILVLASVTGGDRTAEIPTDRINQGLVLGNKVIVGTVNAHRDDFVEGIEDLLRAEATFPGWLGRLLTTRVDGLERPDEMLRGLRDDPDAIKVYVEVARH